MAPARREGSFEAKVEALRMTLTRARTHARHQQSPFGLDRSFAEAHGGRVNPCGRSGGHHDHHAFDPV